MRPTRSVSRSPHCRMRIGRFVREAATPGWPEGCARSPSAHERGCAIRTVRVREAAVGRFLHWGRIGSGAFRMLDGSGPASAGGGIGDSRIAGRRAGADALMQALGSRD